MRPGWASARGEASLWLPFRGGAITNASATSLTITTAGSRTPALADGYYGDGLRFGESGDSGVLSRLEVAAAAGIAYNSVLTGDVWVYNETFGSESPIITRNDQSGSQNDQFEFLAGDESATFKVFSTTTSATVTGTWVGTSDVARWTHFRFVMDATYLYIYRDGQLIAKDAHGLANIQNASLPPLQIGSESSQTRSADFCGILADVVLRGSADTDITTIPCNVPTQRRTGRVFRAVDLDLKCLLTDESWTDDGAGGWWITLSTIALSPWIISEGDILQLAYTDGGTRTVQTRGWAITDIQASSNEWFHDLINSRLYISTDPATLDDIDIVVRCRMADRGMPRGNRYYWPIVSSAEAGERRMAWFDEPAPTMGGGTLVLHAKHPDLPDGFLDEDASSILWTGADVRIGHLSDGTGWGERISQFRGFVDEPPVGDGETFSVAIRHEAGRFYKLPLSETIASLATYADMLTDADGTPFWWIWGRGHKEVPCVPVNAKRQTSPGGVAGSYQYKIAGHQIAAIEQVGIGVGGLTWFYDVDLSDATFWNGNDPAFVKLWAHVAGYGPTLTDPTSTPGLLVNNYGDPSEASLIGSDIIWYWLALLLGLTTTDKGTTWASTAGRALVNWRMADPAPDPGSLVNALQRIQAETQTFLYYGIALEKWQLEDIVKADAKDWELRDPDVIAESYFLDRSKLAKRANIVTLNYKLDSQGAWKRGEGTTLALEADSRYQAQEVWTPQGSALAGFYDKAAADNWLTAVRNLLESPMLKAVVRVSRRFASVEIMDVVNSHSSQLAAETRFRVYGIKPVDNGYELLLGSEELFGATGTSTQAGRAPILPQIRYHFGDETPLALASTAGAWTRVAATAALIFQGGLDIPSGVTHSLAVRGRRIGGAADTDVQWRLYDTTNSLVIASIAGNGTSMADSASTTFANIPTADANIELQYLAETGVTATFERCIWETKESATATPFVESGPSTFWLRGDAGGESLATSNAWVVVGNAQNAIYYASITIPLKFRWVIDCNLNGATTLQFRIMRLVSSSSSTVQITFDVISSGTRQFVSEVGPPALQGLYFLQYQKTGAAAPIFYGISADIVHTV